jgi:phenylpropionate dioxygenase-like ring-hydroxylating dioxygenase large terminal subunit
MRLQTQHALLERAKAHISAGSTDMAPHALHVDAAHYADPAVLAEEVERHFLRRPVLVGLTPDVPTPGSYVARDIVGRPLLLVRGNDGVARTFVNACRHRGTRLAEGRGEARSFPCPFHAWNYGRDGELLARPNSCNGFDAMTAADSNLLALPTRERAGLVFALLEPGGEAGDIDARLDALVGGIEDELASYDIAAHDYFASRSGVRHCNYKLVMDTFTEAYHISALHKDSIRPFYYSNPALTDAFGAVTRMIGVRTSIEKEWPKPAEERRFVRHGTIQYIMAPNIVLTHQVDHMQMWQMYPVAGDPSRCEVNLHLYWPRPVDEAARKKCEFNLDVLWRVTNDEDFPQCENAQRAMAGGALPNVVFGRNEPGGVYYHRAMDAGMRQPLTRAVG